MGIRKRPAYVWQALSHIPTHSPLIKGKQYLTLRRVASDGICHGLLPQMAAYAKNLCSSLRIDTHQSNYIMQKQIERAGFQRCGIIYVRDGSPRIAYQWVADSTLEK